MALKRRPHPAQEPPVSGLLATYSLSAGRPDPDPKNSRDIDPFWVFQVWKTRPSVTSVWYCHLQPHIWTELYDKSFCIQCSLYEKPYTVMTCVSLCTDKNVDRSQEHGSCGTFQWQKKNIMENFQETTGNTGSQGQTKTGVQDQKPTGYIKDTTGYNRKNQQRGLAAKVLKYWERGCGTTDLSWLAQYLLWKNN